VIDPYERDTRVDERDTVRGLARQAANRAMAQLPGLSSRFPTRPSLLTGQPKKTALGELGVPARIAAQFSPANISSYAPQPVAQEISRLARAGEKVSVSFPRPEVNKRTGKPMPLSLQRDVETRFALNFAVKSKTLINNPQYKAATDEVKAVAIESLASNLRENVVKQKPLRPIGDIIESAAASAALSR